MIFEQIAINGDKNFAYLVGDEKAGQVAIVDPGMNPKKLLDRVKANDAKCTLILATHSHYDHIACADDIARATGAPFAAYKTVPGIDRPLDDGQMIHIGDVPIGITFCPGHCADSILLLCGGEKLIVGDEIFICGVGITRSAEQARLHYDNLHNILMKFDDAIEVYPGHDYGAKPSSTIGEQRTSNPYLQQPNFESFWHLRQNWKQYCRENGIAWG